MNISIPVIKAVTKLTAIIDRPNDIEEPRFRSTTFPAAASLFFPLIVRFDDECHSNTVNNKKSRHCLQYFVGI